MTKKNFWNEPKPKNLIEYTRDNITESELGHYYDELFNFIPEEDQRKFNGYARKKRKIKTPEHIRKKRKGGIYNPKNKKNEIVPFTGDNF